MSSVRHKNRIMDRRAADKLVRGEEWRIGHCVYFLRPINFETMAYWVNWIVDEARGGLSIVDD